MRLSIFLNLRFSPVVQKLKCKNMFPRLGNKYLSNPAEFCNLYSMVNVEVEAKKADGSSSCINGLLWLTRAMDFIVESFRNLMEHEDLAMSQVRSEAYTKTLKKYHGWLASSTFSVAMKLAPDRKKFMAVVGGTDDIKSDIEKFTPLLQENHKFLSPSPPASATPFLSVLGCLSGKYTTLRSVGYGLKGIWVKLQ